MNNIQYFILSGGGMPAIYAFVGAAQELAKQQPYFFQNLKAIAGSSIGSVGAYMLALNNTPEEMLNKLNKVDFSKFKIKHPFLHPIKVAKSAHHLFCKYHVLNENLIMDILLDALKERINEQTLHWLGHTKYDEVTFRDLQRLGFKDLYVITSKLFLLDNKTAAEEVIFSPETTPDTSVAWATYASTAAPFFFPKVRLQEVAPGKFIRSNQGDIYDDGGLMNNFLIELFDKRKYMLDIPLEQCVNSGLTNPHTLGLNLDVIGKRKSNPNAQAQILPYHKPLKYAKALLRTGLTFDKKNLNPANTARSILIDRHDLNFFAFGIKDEMKDLLLETGRQSVRDYLMNNQINNQYTAVPTQGNMYPSYSPF